MGSIYMWTNRVNSKRYIGKCHRDVIKRRRDHIRGKGSKLLKRAIDKYGIDNFDFEILHDGILDDFLSGYEIEAIRKYKSKVPNGYNLTDGGEGLLNPSDEIRRKMGLAHKGKSISVETRQKLSKAKKGKKVHTPETRRKLSKISKSRRHTPETRRKISQSNKGKKLSEEHRQQISEAQKGRKHSEEHRRKNSEAHKGEKNHNYGKKLSPERRQQISEARQRIWKTPELIAAREYFFSLPSSISLAEKRKYLRQKFFDKDCMTIWRWCRKFDSESPPK